MGTLIYSTTRKARTNRWEHEDLGVKHDSKIWRRRMAGWKEQTDRAYMLALRTTGSPALAEEAVQEACMRILQNPPEDRGDEAAAAYFLKVVRGVAVNLVLSSKNRRQREENHGVAAEKKVRAPDEIAAASETARAARAALETLPQEEREAICLCCEQSLTHRMAAYVLQEPEKTVTDRVQRGLEKLRRRLVAQGFAAAAPVVLGQQLAELGIPPAPAVLAGRIRELGASARESIRAAGNAAGRKASGNLAVKMVLGAAVAGAVVAVVLKPWQTAPAGNGAAAKPQAQTEDKPLHLTWAFEQGPAVDLKIAEGAWQWRAADEKASGSMSVADGSVVVVLPLAIPARPVLVAVKHNRWQAAAKGGGRYSSGCGWAGTKAALPYDSWSRIWNGRPAGSYEVRHYFVDRSKITMVVADGEQRITGIKEYKTPYPSQEIFLSFINFRYEQLVIEEIELRTLDEQDIPSEVRDAEALKKGMKFRQFRPDTSDPADNEGE